MVHNHPGGRASQFNLTLQPYRFEEFAAKNHELQTSPTSGFVQTTVSYRFTSDSVLCLRGAILKIVDKDGVSEQVIDNQAQYEQTLRERFDLDLGDLSDLWSRVWERHLAWAAAQNAG